MTISLREAVAALLVALGSACDGGASSTREAMAASAPSPIPAAAQADTQNARLNSSRRTAIT
ncbi:MAG: hypothetical protein ABI910_04935, partial [Gemmatimonadota bacterium]